MMSTSLRVPAGRFQDECLLCRVQQGGTVVAFRNHAHRLARGLLGRRQREPHVAVHAAHLPESGQRCRVAQCQILEVQPLYRTAAHNACLQLSAAEASARTREGLKAWRKCG